MQYNFASFNAKIEETEEWLKKEFQGLRTGRATPAILDVVSVDAYGAKMPVNQLATVGVEDARTLRIAPWDVTMGKAIEKAIQASNLGLSVNVDDKGLRVSFPELTSERRESLLKVAKSKLEDARIALRSEREKVWDDIQAKEKEGGMSEDDKFRLKEQMQRLVDDANARFEEAYDKKEKEIHS